MINLKSVTAYIKIIRPVNTVMTGVAVALGAWLTFADTGDHPLITLAALMQLTPIPMLMLAAMAAAAYGNVINDIRDIKSDRVSHPNRPLVDGTMPVRAAKIYAAGLAAASLTFAGIAGAAYKPWMMSASSFSWEDHAACEPLWIFLSGAGWITSTFYLFATLAPLILLTLYSIYFKRTRLVGNIVVSILPAYALLFGALPRPMVKILLLPAILAFLLNFCREIVKDIQDTAGDKAAGWTTSADLRPATIKNLLMAASAAYISMVLMPAVIFGHFGMAYVLACLLTVVPIHIYWTVLMQRSGIRENARRIGLLLKLEMAAGLFALAFDKCAMYFIK